MTNGGKEKFMTVKETRDTVTELQPLPSVRTDSIRRKSTGLARSVTTLPNASSAAFVLRASKQHPTIQTDTTLFCRYELKYRITETKARALAAYVQPYIHPDRYAKTQPGYQYPISSLYMDSSSLTLCSETLRGKKNRFKLRIRGYDDNPQSPVFLEVKRRINNVILKSRVMAEKEALTRILNGRYTPSYTYEKDRQAFQQFMLYVTSLNARPVVLIRYMRQAFEGDSDNRVRITFDRQLSFKTTRQPTVCLNGSGWKSVTMDFVILEIKFTARYPLWLSDMVKIFDLKQSAMSKYVSSVQQSCALGFCAPGIEQVWCYDE